MKIIQSYIPWRNPNKILLGRDYIYTMMLSSLLLKKNYGNVELYTNSIQKKFLDNFNFPYTYNTNVLESDKADVFAITKLKAMLHQTEEFIHFDLDRFMVSLPNLTKRKSPFIFSHNDVASLITDVNKLDRFEEKVGSVSFLGIYNTYLKFYLKNIQILETIEDFPHDFIKYDEIPNMNFIYVKDVPTFSEAIKKSINVYSHIKTDINSEWIGSAFIEQFTLPLYLKKLSKEYLDNIEESTLFGNSPVSLSDNYFKGNDYCSKCNNLHDVDEKFRLYNSDFDFNLFSYFHIGGIKFNDVIQFLVIRTLINNFGKDVVMDIHKKYIEFSLNNKTTNELTPGERLYEKYAGEYIFTNMNKKSIF